MDDRFEYTYSAPTEDERREIENIRQAYVSEGKKRGDIEKLKNLDRKVKNPPLVLALTTGIIATLILGFGMTLVMEWSQFLPGIIVGAAGAILMILNPFIYKAFFTARKNKYREEILSLSDKLLNIEEK